MEDEAKFIPNIENLLGLTVDITLSNKTKISGNIYTLNQKSKMLILNIGFWFKINENIDKKNENDNFNITFVNMLQIQKIDLSKKQINIKVDELYLTNLNNIKEKERINLEKDNLIKRIETEPNYKKGLDIYKTLSKFYNCSYDGKKIVIKGIDCYIEEPFKPQNINCNNNKIKEKLVSLIF